MNKQVKKQWVKALRSGKYEQGRNCLKNGDRFCCLGVLTDLYLKSAAGKKDGYIRWREEDDNEHGLNPSVEYLYSVVIRWAGLESNNPYLDKACSVTAVRYNDAELYSFNKIANLIEKNL